jgi:hypothetical protein
VVKVTQGRTLYWRKSHFKTKIWQDYAKGRELDFEDRKMEYSVLIDFQLYLGQMLEEKVDGLIT